MNWYHQDDLTPMQMEHMAEMAKKWKIQNCLIAAAPDMLEALESAQQQLEAFGRSPDVLEKVISAIAKAKGEEE